MPPAACRPASVCHQHGSQRAVRAPVGLPHPACMGGTAGDPNTVAERLFGVPLAVKQVIEANLAAPIWWL